MKTKNDRSDVVRIGNAFRFTKQNRGDIVVHDHQIVATEEGTELFLNATIKPSTGHIMYLEGICFEVLENLNIGDMEIPRGIGFGIDPSTRLTGQLKYIARTIYREQNTMVRQTEKQRTEKIAAVLDPTTANNLKKAVEELRLQQQRIQETA